MSQSETNRPNSGNSRRNTRDNRNWFSKQIYVTDNKNYQRESTVRVENIPTQLRVKVLLPEQTENCEKLKQIKRDDDSNPSCNTVVVGSGDIIDVDMEDSLSLNEINGTLVGDAVIITERAKENDELSVCSGDGYLTRARQTPPCSTYHKVLSYCRGEPVRNRDTNKTNEKEKNTDNPENDIYTENPENDINTEAPENDTNTNNPEKDDRNDKEDHRLVNDVQDLMTVRDCQSIGHISKCCESASRQKIIKTTMTSDERRIQLQNQNSVIQTKIREKERGFQTAAIEEKSSCTRSFH
ncbi:Hypothetical predicted protein [Mytilus galloprovincialis]|uniref:Uncharacterized protein n=1 Tax=Mytilus galloprovincialis TaxID=29158 RepID=A0A8B6CL81_MYTGA|nr:Hypothetical predicted protein [Mytilus galloprovincialis]